MVDRCICFDTTFKEILELVESGKTLEEVMEETGAGQGCGMCIPYIQLTIETKQVDHPVTKF
tara:strand:+ start:485477 stop:485662 length:186 start_codon:yes stop_codon:yes gene_type:complete